MAAYYDGKITLAEYNERMGGHLAGAALFYFGARLGRGKAGSAKSSVIAEESTALASERVPLRNSPAKGVVPEIVAEQSAAMGKGLPTEETVTFYHGTNSEFAANIRANGVDPFYGRPNLDFGQGFYTTKSLTHALERAQQIVKHYGGTPSVLEFRVPRAELNNLRGLHFSDAGPAWQNFVKENRLGAPPHGYDIVSGPVWRRFTSEGTPLAWDYPELNQTSFHSEAAAKLLTKGLQ